MCCQAELLTQIITQDRDYLLSVRKRNAHLPTSTALLLCGKAEMLTQITT